MDGAENTGKAEEIAFGDLTITVSHRRVIFGETLGCGYMMNMLLAAAYIRNGICSRLLVSGIDMTGNYTCVMLEK